MGKILFVCQGNTCRSVISEYLARRRFGEGHIFESAGINPQLAAEAANAIQALNRNFGIDASRHVPRGVDRLDLADFDLVIAMDKHVDDSIVPSCAAHKLKLWKIPDPYGDNSDEYDRACQKIAKQLNALFQD